MARLILDCDGVAVITHALIDDVITIGRAPSSDVVIDDPTVSAQHAALTKLPSGYRLTDLGSTNGTQVDGISITDAELKDGAEIRFGYVLGVFRGPTSGPGDRSELETPRQPENAVPIQVLETQPIFSPVAQ